MKQVLTLAFICLTTFVFSQTPELQISSKNNSEYEVKMVERIKKLASEYDLAKWTFTRKIIIEDYAIPHSHPVLTMNTKNQSDDSVLSTFIHEQTHWFMEANGNQVSLAIGELKKKYPEVPIGNSEGARDEYSTYLHLLVCYLEFDGLKSLVGQERARVVIEDMNHYKWIYKQVLNETDYLKKIVNQYGLTINE